MTPEPPKRERLIVLLAAGSRGDTQPFVALGCALQRKGFGVRIAAATNFKELVEAYGLEFHSVAGDLTSLSSKRDIQKLMRAGNPITTLLSFNTLRQYAYELQRGYHAACLGADAVIFHPGATVGYAAAKAQGIPSILATPFPMTPTRAYPALVFYDAPRLGAGANLLSHLVFEQVLWRTSKDPVQRFWRKTFGTLPQGFTNPFAAHRSAHRPTVVSCSDEVFPRPADWPEHVHNTGYWFVDEHAGWTPPADLIGFLAAGPPPIYVGFGGLGDPTTAARTGETVVAALQRAGQRGVLATGLGGLALASVPESIFVLKEVPHSWLLPRMAAVVHHGGAGTTAAGFRAGVPQVIVPHGVDQFAWGRRVQELGVGPGPIRKRHLRADTLAAAIQQALGPTFKQGAEALGRRIRLERGAETAAEIIAACLRTSR